MTYLRVDPRLEALFRNPSLEAADAHWNAQPFGPSGHPTVPLAAVHIARLQWLEATDAMLAESLQWLQAYGYSAATQDPPPLTPETRDQVRAGIGRPPLAAGDSH